MKEETACFMGCFSGLGLRVRFGGSDAVLQLKGFV